MVVRVPACAAGMPPETGAERRVMFGWEAVSGSAMGRRVVVWIVEVSMMSLEGQSEGRARRPVVGCVNCMDSVSGLQYVNYRPVLRWPKEPEDVGSGLTTVLTASS